MTTIINNPSSGGERDSTITIIIGVLAGLILITLFFIYVLPVIRGNKEETKNDGSSLEVKLSSGGSAESALTSR